MSPIECGIAHFAMDVTLLKMDGGYSEQGRKEAEIAVVVGLTKSGLTATLVSMKKFL